VQLLFVVITYGKGSLWVRKSLENSGNFFFLLYDRLICRIDALINELRRD